MKIDFNHTPFIVFWEITRACALACRHCRAAAQPYHHPQELNTAEGIQLIDDIADMGTSLLIITGGDPMMRSDLFQFINHAAEKGLQVSLAPSATPLVNLKSLTEAKRSGLARASISLDGSTAAIHDTFRRTPGSFQRTLEVIKLCREVSLPFQINTTVSRYNLGDLKELAPKIAEFGTIMWDLFFLVPTGRAEREDMISAEEHEKVLHWLYELSQQAPFDIKTTAAPHYRRVILQKMPGGTDMIKGINDGRGCCFISHIGDVCPSGFLPTVAGNVRQQPLAEIYRHSPIFTDLRDSSKLKGKCRVCEYNQVCGGSRARAYAITGNYLEAEPCCLYRPAGWVGEIQPSLQ